MNRKLISGAMALVMAFGCVFTAAACREENAGGGGNSGTGGGGNGAGNQTVAPGTVITDRATTEAILGALEKTEPKGLTFTASAALAVKTGEETAEQDFLFEGAATFGQSFNADVCGTYESDGETSAQYLLAFLRGEDFYLAAGDCAGEPDLAAIKAQLKDRDDPLVLEREAFPAAATLASPAVFKLIRNLTSLSEGKIIKTEGGYSLSYDLLDAAEGLLGDAQNLISTVETATDMTVSGFFGQKFVTETLGKLLGGITAKECKELIAPFLPEEIANALPEANGTAFSYLESCLRSGAFYTAVLGEDESLSQWKTFGETPLSALAERFTGGGVADLGIGELLGEWKDDLEGRIVGLLLPLLSLEGTPEGAVADLAVEYLFDEEKKVLGFSIDAAAAADLVPDATEGGGSEGGPGTSEGDTGSGDSGSDTGSDTGSGDNGSSGGGMGNGDPGAARAGQKPSVRANVKIAATLQSAPELFDLTGCKYSGEEGEGTIAR